MECRPGCGVCCEYMSISSPIPGMPEGKPIGVRYLHLNYKNLCDLFRKPERPDICRRFQATPEVCGENREEAIELIKDMEVKTKIAFRLGSLMWRMEYTKAAGVDPFKYNMNGVLSQCVGGDEDAD